MIVLGILLLSPVLMPIQLLFTVLLHVSCNKNVLKSMRMESQIAQLPIVDNIVSGDQTHFRFGSASCTYKQVLSHEFILHCQVLEHYRPMLNSHDT